MKKRYSTARPYGTWLSEEVVRLSQIVESVPDSLLTPPPINGAFPPAAANGKSNGKAGGGGKTGVMRLLQPLKAFGYTVSRPGGCGWLQPPLPAIQLCFP